MERIVKRFGDENERVMALKGLVKEAEAPNDEALDEILKEYSKILTSNNTNIVCLSLHIEAAHEANKLSGTAYRKTPHCSSTLPR